MWYRRDRNGLSAQKNHMSNTSLLLALAIHINGVYTGHHQVYKQHFFSSWETEKRCGKHTLTCWVVGDKVGVAPNCSGGLGSSSTSTGRAVAHTATSRSPPEAGVENHLKVSTSIRSQPSNATTHSMFCKTLLTLSKPHIYIYLYIYIYAQSLHKCIRIYIWL